MLGDLVRDCRRRLGWSQEDLAARAGVSVRAIRKIETYQTGTPRPATVRLLADTLGLRGTERDSFCRIGLDRPTGSRGVPDQPPMAGSGAPSSAEPLTTGRDGAHPAQRFGAAATSTRTGPSPAQLPVAIPTFTGRDVELARLDALLRVRSGPDPLTRVPAVVISAVSGTAGVGKPKPGI